MSFSVLVGKGRLWETPLMSDPVFIPQLVGTTVDTRRDTSVVLLNPPVRLS